MLLISGMKAPKRKGGSVTELSVTERSQRAGAAIKQSYPNTKAAYRLLAPTVLGYLRRVLHEGNERAREIAEHTLQDVRTRMHTSYPDIPRRVLGAERPYAAR